jgi:hypothetical protein
MQDITSLITDELEYAAEWRREKAAEYPEDADRNLEAAQTLDRMAADIKKFQGSQWHWRLQGLFDGPPGTVLRSAFVSGPSGWISVILENGRAVLRGILFPGRN